MFIQTQSELEEFAARAMKGDFLGVDTEFLREKTYYAKLCLLQLSTQDECVLVDPFAISDWSPVRELMTSPNIVKVAHSCTQDIELLYRLLNAMPAPIFDTQIAASFVGDAVQIGYGALVSRVCGITLRKSESFTDWSKRPLTESQMDYALDDVRYLHDIYSSMVAKMRNLGRLDWLEEDFAKLSDPKRYEVDPRERYLHLKRNSHLTRKQLSAAREVAAWREGMAQKRDIPRKWVVSDEQVVEICKKCPATIDELFQIRGVRERLSTADARKVVEMVQKGIDLPESEWPMLSRPSANYANVDAQMDLMQAVARLRARENNISMNVLAPHGELEMLARGITHDVSLLTGWRKRMLGDELVKLLDGALSLRLDGAKLIVEESR